MSNVHLSLAERHYIEIERKAGNSMNQIANRSIPKHPLPGDQPQ